MRKKQLLILLTVFFGAVLFGKTVSTGPWEFSFDEKNGYWQTLKWNGDIISENKTGIAPFNWGPGYPLGKCVEPDLFTLPKKYLPNWENFQKSAPCALEKYEFNKSTKTLNLYYRIGEYRIRTEIVFGMNGNKDLLGQTFYMDYVPEKPTDQPGIIFNFAVQYPASRTGRYMRPGDSTDIFTDLAKLKGEVNLQDHWTRSAFSLWEYKPNRTIIFYVDEIKDHSNLSVAGGKETLWIQGNFAAHGWIYPKETQVIGPFCLQVHKKDADTALKGGCWELMESLGIHVPKDRAKWLDNSMLYCFFPLGNANAKTNLGGFKAAAEELVPRVKWLGLNTMWTLPVEDWYSYYPRDYRKINPSIGTAADYKALVKTAQSAGIRFMQDNVPHGGEPAFGEIRGNKPWDLAYDKEGNPRSYWCFDYGSPSWREYMGKVVFDLATTYGLDGFRIDVPGGSGTWNWRRKDFPNLKKVPNHVPAGWYKKSLEENGGKFPPIPFMRASNTVRESGVLLLQVLRENMKKVKKDGVILAEVDFYPYQLVCDVMYDKILSHMVIRDTLLTKPIDYNVDRFMRLQYLNYWTYPRNTFQMRYEECHDMLTTRGLIGIGLEQAAIASTFMMSGMPMIYQDTDIGIGPFIRELAQFRMDLPEIRGPEDLFYESEVSSKTVFHILRRKGDKVSIGLINFTGEPQEVEVSLPVKFLKAPYVCSDYKTRKKIALSNKNGKVSFKITLAPWGWNAAVFRDLPAKSVKSAHAQKIVKTGTVKISETDAGYKIFSPGYSGYVSKNGSFSMQDAKGNKLIKSLTLAKVQNVALNGKTISIQGKGGSLSLTFAPGKVLCKSSGNVDLKAFDAESWKVYTAEGALEDVYRKHPKYGKSDYSTGRRPAIVDISVIWDSSASMPDFIAPWLVWKNANSGLTIERQNFLTPETGIVSMRNRVNGDDGCYTCFEGKQEFVLYPMERNSSVLGNKKTIGEFTFVNTSREWEIRHAKFTAYITRNGKVRAIKNSSGKEILLNFKLDAMGGYGQPSIAGSIAHDHDSKHRIYVQNGHPVLEIDGHIRYSNVWSSIQNRNPCVTKIRYVFGENGAGFRGEFNWFIKGKFKAEHIPTFRFDIAMADYEFGAPSIPVRTLKGGGSITFPKGWEYQGNWYNIRFTSPKLTDPEKKYQENVIFAF